MVKPNGLQIKYKMFNNIHDFQLLLKCSRMLGLEMFHLKKKSSDQNHKRRALTPGSVCRTV